MSHGKILPLLLFAVAACLPAQKKPVTLESLKQTAAPDGGISSIEWAPDGKRFAYLQDKSLWLYDVPSRTKRQLVSIGVLESAATETAEPERFQWQNRRVKEQTFQWSSSGDSLLISAGGDLFLFRVAAGGYNRITATPEAERDPKLSPDGRRVSFRRGHDLYCLDLDADEVTRLTHDGSEKLRNAELDWVYPEELDLGTAHWWSPDSTRIAYLQFDVSREPLHPHIDFLPLRAIYEPERYPKAGEPNADVRLGVVDPDGGRTKWIDLGETRERLLARVDWTPDSKSLLVQLLNRIQNRLDLVRASVEAGTASLVLREQDPYWVNVADDLRFLKEGRELLWSSERDGFRHLYRYSIEGEQLTQLTSGQWLVTEVAGVDEKGGHIFYVSTEQSPLERHLYRVGLDGNGRRRITSAAGTHAISMAPTCEYYVDTSSSLKNPTGRVIHTADGSEWAVFTEPDRKPLEEYEILPTEMVEVKASDGALMYARLIRPAGFRPEKKYPAIVKVYGGPHAQRVQDSWTKPDWDQVMAHRGFVIWELDNRGTSGRGHAWESAVFRSFGAKELEDQKEGIRHLLSLSFVNPDRIGIHGWSYGGYMTLYSLLHAPEIFRAGIAGAPVTDWRNYDTIYTERYMGLPSENEEGYRKSSPVHYTANLKARLLLIHNLEDDNVLFQNTMQMASALQKAGKQFEMMIYPQKTHGVTGPAKDHMNGLMALFFEKHLKN